MKTTQSNILNSINLIPLGLVSLSLLSGTILVSSTVSAEDPSVVDQINITVPISCTLSGTGMNTHNAEISNGQYNSAIGETTLKAFCNDNNGFAIYAIGYTDNEDGKNVLTNATLGSAYDIVTGTAISGDTSNWAMKLSTITSHTPTYPIIIAGSTDDTEKEQGDPDYSSFQEVPADYTLVAKRTAGTDIGTNAEGATLTTTYQTYISKTQPAGTYTGQVKYTLVHPHDGAKPIIPGPVECESGKICYNANANGVMGTMGKQDLSRDKDWSQCSFTNYVDMCGGPTGFIDINTLPEIDQYKNSLYASNFSREGYGFAGWNDKYDMTGNNYGPIQTVTLPLENVPNGLSLYAHWVESSGELQNWTGCSSLSTNQVIGLTDTRDGNVYAVSKLADGNCWMIENLRLDNSATSLNSANTNNPASGFTSLAASNSNWCTSYDNETCINQNYLNADNTTLFMANNSSSQDGNIYSYGNYYNWYSATAGNGTYSLTDSDAPGDICPAGWHLPSGNTNDQFANLNNAIHSVDASATLRDYPANFVYSGILSGSNINYRGYGGSGRGEYMTRTPAVNNLVYRTSIYSTNNIDTYYDGRCVGRSVRCLVD